MAIIPQVPQPTCPVAQTPAPAPKTDTAAPAPYHDPLVDKFGEQATTIPCPFWKVMLNSGIVHPDAQGNISIDDMRTALSDVGAKTGLRETAILGVKNVLAPMMGVHGMLATMNMDHINVFDLRKSPLMHTGDSGILRDGFNQQRLDRLLSFSSDGDRVTLADLAAANKDQVAKDPGDHGHTLGTAEYTLLITAFGFQDENGDKYLSKQDLTTIYKDCKFPEGWEKRDWGAIRAGLNVAEFVKDQKNDTSHPSTTGATAEVAGAGANSSSKVSGGCPFLQGKPFTAEEAVQQHADKLPPQQ